MSTLKLVIEDWDGDGGIRIPDEALQELGVDVGDVLYLVEEYVGTTRCLVLSKPRGFLIVSMSWSGTGTVLQNSHALWMSKAEENT